MTVQVNPAESGGWLAFAAGPRLLVVAPSSEDGFVAAAWAAISRPDGFQAVLDLLASRGLSAMSPFALVEWSGSVARVIVRGEAAVEIEDAAATGTLTGEGISTWLERSLPGVTAFSVSVPGAKAAGTVPLPLESGVALAARVGSFAEAL